MPFDPKTCYLSTDTASCLDQAAIVESHLVFANNIIFKKYFFTNVSLFRMRKKLESSGNKRKLMLFYFISSFH